MVFLSFISKDCKKEIIFVYVYIVLICYSKCLVSVNNDNLM